MPELSEREIEERLDAWPVARLASIAADGRPHQVPIVFARAGGWLCSPVDGKPKSGGELARVRHLRARPRASLLLDEYAADWTRLWWIAIDADASVLGPGDSQREPFQHALRALRAKYPQYGSVPLLGDPPTLLAFRPVRTRSWCARSGQ